MLTGSTTPLIFAPGNNLLYESERVRIIDATPTLERYDDWKLRLR